MRISPVVIDALTPLFTCVKTACDNYWQQGDYDDDLLINKVICNKGKQTVLLLTREYVGV